MKVPTRKFKCLDCGHEFEVPFGIPKWSIKCEKCGSPNIVRVDIGAPVDIPEKASEEVEEMRGFGNWFGRFWGWCRGFGRGFGRGQGRGCGRGWGRGQGFGRGRGFGRGWW